MPLSRVQRLQRLRSRLSELEMWGDRARLELSGWLCEGSALALGDPWPRREGVLRLELPEVGVPGGWPLEQVRLELDLGGEGLLWIHYRSGAQQALGLDPFHRRLRLREPVFWLQAELVARLPFGAPHPDPRLRLARLVWVEAELGRLQRVLSLLAAAAAALPADDDVADLLLELAERSLSYLEWPSASQPYLGRLASHPLLAGTWSPPTPSPRPEPLPESARRSVRAALALLDSELPLLRDRYPPRGKLALAGHAHIDLAWLWPLEETVRKVQRTFHTAVDLLERYPELTFVQSSAELHRLAAEADPRLWAAVRRWAAEGRWEATGGMWVEPDLNMPAGESIVRQLFFGQRFFQRELGRRHRLAWLPDTFGFTPALPQLLLGAGIDSFFTTKLTWSETDRFPLDLFWWEGLDGSRVLAHCFESGVERPPGLGSYNGDPGPDALLGVWANFRGRLLHPESLYTLGYGDGGGGPTDEMLEQVRELTSFPALPALAFGRAEAFFERLRASAAGRELPCWVGELYLQLHRGTLTTQGRTKWLHRRVERDLVAAEVANSLCTLAGTQAPGADLERAWKLLLRNQFHDILCGTGVGEVHRQAEAELAEADRAALEAIEGCLDRLAEVVAPSGEQPATLVVNPDLSPRPLRLQLPEPLPGAQPVEEGWALSADEQLAGLEAAVVLGGTVAAPAAAWEGVLENEMVRVELAPEGTLASVFDKRVGREVLAGPGNQLWAYVDKPRDWDAWELDAGYAEQGEELGPPESVEVLERGPHRAALRLRWSWRSSRLTQVLRLWAVSPRLEFHTRLEWHDRRFLLKARFPLAVRSARATFETAFGVVERPTHRNTSWDAAQFEVAGHRFADLSEPGYGVALLNDGRYGHHVLGSEIGLSLLRSPAYPDPLADEGEHRFTYALLPHPGSWLEGGVLMEAEDLNRPLLVCLCRSGGAARWRPLTVEGMPLGLGALKATEDGTGLVLRLYEPQGARGQAYLSLPGGWELAQELNLLEDPLGPPELIFSPFQVRTYLLARSPTEGRE